MFPAQLKQLQSELKGMMVDCRGGDVGSCNIMLSLADHELCNAEHS